MKQPLFSLKAALGVGLFWSLMFYLALAWMPRDFSGHPGVHRWGLAATGAVLTLMSALRLNRRWPSLFFAWIILFIFGAAELGPGACTLGAAAVAGGVRAGVRLPVSGLLASAAELTSMAGTVVLAIWFRPTSAAVVALGIWLFYLLQVGPLLVCDTAGHGHGAEASLRRFEQTRRRVEKLLARRI